MRCDYRQRLQLVPWGVPPSYPCKARGRRPVTIFYKIPFTWVHRRPNTQAGRQIRANEHRVGVAAARRGNTNALSQPRVHPPRAHLLQGIGGEVRSVV